MSVIVDDTVPLVYLAAVLSAIATTAEQKPRIRAPVVALKSHDNHELLGRCVYGVPRDCGVAIQLWLDEDNLLHSPHAQPLLAWLRDYQPPPPTTSYDTLVLTTNGDFLTDEGRRFVTNALLQGSPRAHLVPIVIHALSILPFHEALNLARAYRDLLVSSHRGVWIGAPFVADRVSVFHGMALPCIEVWDDPDVVPSTQAQWADALRELSAVRELRASNGVTPALLRALAASPPLPRLAVIIVGEEAFQISLQLRASEQLSLSFRQPHVVHYFNGIGAVAPAPRIVVNEGGAIDFGPEEEAAIEGAIARAHIGAVWIQGVRLGAGAAFARRMRSKYGAAVEFDDPRGRRRMMGVRPMDTALLAVAGARASLGTPEAPAAVVSESALVDGVMRLLGP